MVPERACSSVGKAPAGARKKRRKRVLDSNSFLTHSSVSGGFKLPAETSRSYFLAMLPKDTVTVANKANMTPDSRCYASETERRIADLIGDILAAQRSGATEIDGLMYRLREQAKASRQAGFPGIARLCGKMENCLAMIPLGNRQQSTGLVATLLGACETIHLHADAVAKGMIRAHCGRRQTLAGSRKKERKDVPAGSVSMTKSFMPRRSNGAANLEAEASTLLDETWRIV